MRAVIFGASRGLGFELAKHVCSLGFLVTGWGRSQRVLAKWRSENPLFEYQTADLAREDGQRHALNFLSETPVSRVFCVAGGGPFGRYHEREWKDHEWAWQVSFAFPAQVLHLLASRELKPQVVLIGSSVAESSADPNAASYCAAKHALKGLFATLRVEYPDWDLRLFSPGYMDTDLLPKNAAVRSQGVYSPAQMAKELWSWTLTADVGGHKMYAKHSGSLNERQS